MKFTCLKDILKKSLNVCSTVSIKSDLEILNNVLLSVKGNKMIIKATDLEVGINYTIEGKGEKDGDVVASAKILIDLLNNIKEDKIHLEVKDNCLTLKNDNGEYNIQIANIEEYPDIPSIESEQYISMSIMDLEICLNQVVKSVGDVLGKEELNSIYIYNKEDNLIFVSTDTFRLSERKLNKNQFSVNINEEIGCIVPIKSVHSVLKVIGSLDDKESECKIYINSNQIYFDFSNVNLISKLIEGTYLKYSSIIPSSFDVKINLKKDDLVSAVKTTSVFSTKIKDLFFEVNSQNNMLVLKGLDTSKGSGSNTLKCSVEGVDLKIAFNYPYLLDGLESIKDEEIFIGLNKDRPGLIKSLNKDDYIYIIAPLKL
ncbi:MAG: DNA polymerase III subunit beta [Candidatus Pacebacteria bacterium]|nr:DNA polymerase III subunit beta [Candidatus Paceibacterota bacterium]